MTQENLADAMIRRIGNIARRFQESSLWVRFNDRRATLIDKELGEGLTADEQAELRQLQDTADRFLDLFYPLPEAGLAIQHQRRLAGEARTTPLMGEGVDLFAPTLRTDPALYPTEATHAD